MKIFIISIIILILFKNKSFAETTYELTSSSNYYFIDDTNIEMYKITYTPSSNITLKLATYFSPVDTLINVYPSGTATDPIRLLQEQIGSAINDDDAGVITTIFSVPSVSCRTFPFLCSYVSKSLTAGTEYYILMGELFLETDLTSGPTRFVSNISDLLVTRTSYVLRITDKVSLNKILEILEQINTNGSNSSLTSALDDLSDDNLEIAANQIQGVTIERINGQSFRTHSAFKKASFDALNTSSLNSVVKNNYATLSLNDLNFYQDKHQLYSANSFDFKSMANIFKNKNLFTFKSENSTFFFRTFADQSNQSKVETDIGYENSTAGFLIGNQNYLTEEIEQGWSLGYSSNNTDFDENYGKNSTRTFHASIYQNQQYKNFNIGLNLGSYISKSDLNRNITTGSIQTLESTTYNYGFDATGDIKQSYSLKNNFTFTPSFSTNLSYIIQDDIDEKGGDLALSVENNNLLIIKPEVGFAISKKFNHSEQSSSDFGFSIYGSYEEKLKGTSAKAKIKNTGSNFNIVDDNKNDTFITSGIGYTFLDESKNTKYNFGLYYTENENGNLNSYLTSYNYNKKF